MEEEDTELKEVSPPQNGAPKSPTEEETKPEETTTTTTTSSLSLPLRDRLYFLFDGNFPERYKPIHPKWAKGSIVLQYVTAVMIFVSVLLLALHTLPMYWLEDPDWLSIGQGLSWVYFLIDYGVRLVCCRDKKIFLHSFEKAIDVIALVPYVLLHVGIIRSKRDQNILGSFRCIRAMRMIRLMSDRSMLVTVLKNTLYNAREGVTLLCYLLFISITGYSTATYYAELSVCTFDETAQAWRRPDGSLSPFQSIVHTFWWCLVTLTTTGYGNEVPISVYGKMVASFAVISGIIVLSFPTIVLGGNFQEALNSHSKVEVYKKSPLALFNDMGLSTHVVQGTGCRHHFAYPGGRDNVQVHVMHGAGYATYDAVVYVTKNPKDVVSVGGGVLAVPVILHDALATELAWRAVDATREGRPPVTDMYPRAISCVRVWVEGVEPWYPLANEYHGVVGTFCVLMQVPEQDPPLRVEALLRGTKFRFEVKYRGMTHVF